MNAGDIRLEISFIRRNYYTELAAVKRASLNKSSACRSLTDITLNLWNVIYLSVLLSRLGKKKEKKK